MARDYKERTGLRSGDGEMIHIGDRISEEGAYVAVPVETLERVKTHITIAFEQTKYDIELENNEWNYLRWVLGLIKNELFPEESSKQKQGGK